MVRRRQPALIEVVGSDGVRRFGPGLHSYDELLSFPDADAIYLGVRGHLRRDNLIRERVAEALGHEHVRRVESGVRREPIHTPDSEVVFGVGLIREHRGDVRAAIEDERFALLVKQTLGFGHQFREARGRDGTPSFEPIFVRPETREDHLLISTRLDMFSLIADSAREPGIQSQAWRSAETQTPHSEAPSFD